MLTPEYIDDIKNRVTGYWEEESKNPEFIGIAKGKETGHRIADYVDEKTSSFMHTYYPIAFEHSGNQMRARSMGDFWLKETNIYYPVNVKTGMSNTGQPNMVALRKVLKSILLRQIDSYYLLMIKFINLEDAPTVYLMDMLDCLDYLSFDSGPGQIMLKSVEFFSAIESGQFDPPQRSMEQKVDYLLKMLVEGDARLFKNRLAKQDDLKEMASHYKNGGIFTVCPKSQQSLNLS